YDYRAYYSRILLQRYWQRRRYSIIKSMISCVKGAILDIGCGSSKIALDFGAIGLDTALNKLRFNTRFNKKMVQGSVVDLPFKDNSFNAVICSEVIGYLPENNKIFFELRRVLMDNGILILGTADYGSWQWPLIEFFYSRVVSGGYAHRHITRYKKHSLIKLIKETGFTLLDEKSILGAETILKFKSNKKL
ncbi:MAG: class I SAM-dependent methyltransferase, partial [Candidatus Omnitrophica bacterium]|nr:class I SAM-dependent methyltransferase [Candidatus Omnitrophota bacterium]